MINNYMMYKSLPTLDLHGEDRISARIKLDEFITDNIKLKNVLVVVIHGIGKGIIKEEVHKYLKHNKNVKMYKIDIFNRGSTIVQLKK